MHRGPYIDGKRHGQWVESTDRILARLDFDDEKKILKFPRNDVNKGSYVDGKKHGQWVETNYASDGSVNYEVKGFYVDDKRQGLWVTDYQDGYVTETPYVDGKEHGRKVMRDGDSKVIYEQTYVDGVEQ